MTTIEETLAERGERYGKFTDHSEFTQGVKRLAQRQGWERLADDQREAVDMIAHKLGRILCGDPDYIDSWHDIIGYAKLVEDRLNQQANQAAPRV